VSGTEKLILQAKDRDTLAEWCGALHYALAMKNGGGFLLQQEEEAGNMTAIDIMGSSAGSMSRTDSAESIPMGRSDSADGFMSALQKISADKLSSQGATPPASPSLGKAQSAPASVDAIPENRGRSHSKTLV
jgi:hypothetical protein